MFSLLNSLVSEPEVCFFSSFVFSLDGLEWHTHHIQRFSRWGLDGKKGSPRVENNWQKYERGVPLQQLEDFVR